MKPAIPFFFGKKYLTVSDKIFLSGRQKIPVMSGFVMTNGNTNHATPLGTKKGLHQLYISLLRTKCTLQNVSSVCG